MGSPQLQPEGAGEGKEAARGEATEKDMTLGVQPRQNRYQNQKLWGGWGPSQAVYGLCGLEPRQGPQGKIPSSPLHVQNRVHSQELDDFAKIHNLFLFIKISYFC